MAKEKLIYWFLTSASVIGLTVTALQYAMENYFAEGKIVIDRLENIARVTGSTQNTGDLANLVKAGISCADAFEKQYEQSLVPSGRPNARPFILPNKYPLPLECITWSAPKELPSADLKAPWISSIDWGNIAQKISIFVLFSTAITAGLKKWKNRENREIVPAKKLQTKFIVENQPDLRSITNPEMCELIRSGMETVDPDEIERLEGQIENLILKGIAPVRKPLIANRPGQSALDKHNNRVMAIRTDTLNADTAEKLIAAENDNFYNNQILRYNGRSND